MTKEQFEEFKSKEMDEGVLFRAFLRRNRDGDIVLYVESDESIESFFENEDTGQSEHWANDEQEFHEFYKKNYDSMDSDDEVGQYFAHKHDKFGDSYVQGGNINCGILRTVGLSDGVEFEIPESYSEETVRDSVETLKDIVEEFYKKFIRPVNVMTEITVQEL